MAIASGTRNEEQVRSGIERWLRQTTAELADATVASLTRPDAGLSSETWFVRASISGGEHRDYVMRLPPAGNGLFPTYDLQRQVDVQNALASAGVPAASPAQYEPDPAWMGAPFMVMPRVAGRVVVANPSYLTVGWLAEAGPEVQAHLLTSFFSTLAAVHRLEPDTAPSGDDASLAATVARAGDYLDWAAAGGAVPTYLDDAREWCAANVPVTRAPASVLWGDVQLSNCVFTESGSVAALLDFELTGIGPAELDLGWFFALHDMTSVLAGGDLPGFAGRAALLEGYRAVLGRTLDGLRWYETFALLRSGSIMVRIARLLAAKGVDDSWLARGNPTEAALRRVRTRSED